MSPEVKSLLAENQDSSILKEMHKALNRAKPMANTQPRRLEAHKELNDHSL